MADNATSSKKMGKKKDDSPKKLAVIEPEAVRKSTRIKQNARVDERVSAFLSKSRKSMKHGSSSSGEEEPSKKQSPTKHTPSDRVTASGKKIGRPKRSVKEVKQEIESDIDDPDPKIKQEDNGFNLGLLDLRPVDEAVSPSKVALNARGMPQRIRKRNRLFFDEDVVNVPLHKKERKEKKGVRERGPRRNKQSLEDHEKKPAIIDDSKEGNIMRQKIGIKLRNLLKLPKAQRWVFNEFFYSNIDRALFLGSNDFQHCLKETFGHLRTTRMNRVEWCVVRRLMGKPRRCSQAFFREERQTLNSRRELVRLIQQRKVTDGSKFRELPDRIPLQLSVNARVTAKLRQPQCGLFTGKVDAVDPSNHTYRITFDRPGLGTHSIPDYDVLLHGEPDMVSMSAMQKRYLSSKMSAPPKPTREPRSAWPEVKDPREVWIQNVQQATFPKQFYEMIVRICKILKEKKLKVTAIKDLNNEAEKMLTAGEEFSISFQRKYAGLLIDLESLNLSLNRFLSAAQQFCHATAPDVCAQVMLAPSYVRAKSVNDAKTAMEAYFRGKPPLDHEATSKLVLELMALVLQLQNLTRPKATTQDRQVLKQTLQKVKSMISPTNLLLFQKCVEVHVEYIAAAFSEDNYLSPLLVPSSTTASKKSASSAVSSPSKVN